MSRVRGCNLAVGLLGWCLLARAPGAAAQTGFQPEVRVREATRLDWEFPAAALDRVVRLPTSYDSRRQRYQLYVPPKYRPERTWPLVVFVSPGDDPLGWRSWQQVCDDRGVLFCAAYGAGNGTPPARRVRLVLDMLDDVRRSYRIDPDRTYLAGQSGGAALACTLAFALPEYFGGVVADRGAAPLHGLAYLQQRVRQRLSLAFVTGAEGGPRELDFLYPLLADLGVRTRLWVAAPGAPATLAEVYAWLEADRERRRADDKAHPGLAASPDGVTPQRLQAARWLALAEGELRHPERTYQAVTLLEGVARRWDRTEAGEKAARRLAEVRAEPRAARLLAEQGGAEERRTLAARARALERSGQPRAALAAWRGLVRAHPGSPEAATAAARVRSLTAALARTPYLGARFAGDTTLVEDVLADSPAEQAGLRRGDRVVRLGRDKVGSLADLQRRFRASKPGDRLAVRVRRNDKLLTLTVEVGSAPLAAER
jgi:hypothetical protein